jgi:DNA repair protein RadC
MRQLSLLEEYPETHACTTPMHCSYQVKVARIGEPLPAPKIDAPELCYEYWMQQIATRDWFENQKEQLVVLLLSTRYNIEGFNLVSMGSVNESIAHPRDVFRPAVVAGSYAIVVMHNHPSGDPSPSQSDHSLTRRLMEGAELLQIKMLDHVIVGKPAEGRQPYFSFKEAGVC